jgi:non-specific serine/threonine protein kinase/serine/threonine-protein kinase
MENNWREVEQVVGELLELPEDECLSKLACSGLAPEIRRRAEELLRAWRDSDGFLDPPERATAPDRLLGQRLGSWRLSSVIGSGGMGTVYLADRDDREFEQHAAVKVIAAGRLSRSTERRFREERQILARLEHPHVARLIDGGVAPDGSPYLVMEYVEGTPIDVWARDAGLRERLLLFRQVCEAVQFAHENLVVHCDLKPANILVTREGAPKLLDFGVARFLEREVEETRTLLHPMTPDYASPEQVRGLRPGTSSDIYSLGVLLHELLTGRRPYRLAGKPLDEVLVTICEQEVEKPRTGVADLDAIILKALQKEPQRRHRSVEKLAADVECYLEGRPVSAQPDTFFYRTWKFVRRRAIPLAAACAVILVALAGGLATLAQSRRAERRFNEVRSLAHAILFDVYDSISGLPGSLPARRLLAARAQKYLDTLERETAGDSALTRELAESYLRLGEVRGSPYVANLGDTTGAVESFRKGVALLEKEAVRYPKATGVQEQLSQAYTGLGVVLTRQGETNEAIAVLRLGIAQTAKLYSHHHDFSHAQQLSLAYASMAQAQDVAHGRNGPLAAFHEEVDTSRKSLEILESSGPQAEESWQVSLASRHFRVGYALGALGDRTGEVSYYQQALDIQLKGDAVMRALAASNPKRPHRRELADGLISIALSRWRCCRDLDAALRDDREALETFEQLAQEDPYNLEARRDIANSCMSGGEILDEAGRRPEALAMYRKAEAVYEELRRADPSSAENTSFLGQVRAQIAALERAR